MSFQQFFIEWVGTNCCHDETLCLGGSHREDENMCLLVSNAKKESQKELLLGCTHEKADDRIMFHLSHGEKVGKFKCTVIASTDTDYFVCSIHNYKKTYVLWPRRAVVCNKIEYI